MTDTDWITCPNCVDENGDVRLCAKHRHPLVTDDYCSVCGRYADQGHVWDCPIEMGL